MPDYKKMYLHLFNTITDTIEELKKAQLSTEKMFMSATREEGKEKAESVGKRKRK